MILKKQEAFRSLLYRNKIELLGFQKRNQLWKHQQRWRESFVSDLKIHTSKWILDGCDWHAFSSGYCSCIKGAQADEEYRSLGTSKVFIVFDDDKDTILALCHGPPIVDRLGHLHSDLYITQYEYEWTMVFTHEQSAGFGPYFSYQNPIDPPIVPPLRRGSS